MGSAVVDVPGIDRGPNGTGGRGRVFVPHRELGRMAGELFLVAFVWGAVAFAVSIDASGRGRHAGFWAVLTLLTGLFGAILYGLVVLTTDDGPGDVSGPEAEPEPETVRVCPDCSSEHGDAPDHCEECGAELGPGDDHPVGRRLMTGSRRYCSNCRSEVDVGANACPSCGAVF